MRVPAPAPAAAAPAAAPPPAAGAAKDDDAPDDSPAAAAPAPAAAAPETAKQAAARAALDDDADDSPAKTEATAAVPAAPREQATDDETPTAADRHHDPAANRAAIEAALNALTPKVRRCYFKFQIPGSAQVKLVATPSGSIESVAVAGDFEGTPTGDCVAAELAAATLPSFKGGSLRLAHTFVLR
jgi:hypothetical protein